MGGVIEKKFRRFAEAAGKTPKQYMSELIEAGVTQSTLAERLDCTRQAVGRIASKYDLFFPGCQLNVDELAEQVWGESLEKHIKSNSGKSYNKMAEELGVSNSTLKRRVRDLGIRRREKKS